MQRLAEDRRYDVKGAGDGESIEITSDHTVTIMRLDEVMVSGLKREMIGDYEVW